MTQVRPEHVILNDAIVRSNYLELHGRAKRCCFGFVSRPVGRSGRSPTAVASSCKSLRISGRPRAAIRWSHSLMVAASQWRVFQDHLKTNTGTNSTGDGRPVLYARDIPGRTEGHVNDILGGNQVGDVPASRKMADGTVMPCVGIIHRPFFAPPLVRGRWSRSGPLPCRRRPVHPRPGRADLRRWRRPGSEECQGRGRRLQDAGPSRRGGRRCGVSARADYGGRRTARREAGVVVLVAGL